MSGRQMQGTSGQMPIIRPALRLMGAAALMLALAACAARWSAARRSPAGHGAPALSTPRVVESNGELSTWPPAVPVPTLSWRLLPPPTPSPTATPSPTPTRVPIWYIVREGDTLQSIADAHHVTVIELMHANQLGRIDAVHPGDRLLILNAPITPVP
jgi:hypothetical protein